MIRSSSLKLSIAALSLFVASAAFAQRPAPKPNQTASQAQQQDDPPQKIGVLEVRLPISAKQNKKFLPGLTLNNFEVYEDGKRQKIEKFISPSQLPLNIALLDRHEQQREAQAAFRKRRGRRFCCNGHNISPQGSEFCWPRSTPTSSCTRISPTAGAADQRAPESSRRAAIPSFMTASIAMIEEKMANLQGSDARRIIVDAVRRRGHRK